MESNGRRVVLRGGALALASTTVGFTASQVLGNGPAAAAEVVGPWTYVSPGESIQAAIDAGNQAVLLGAGDYPLDSPILPRSGCAIRGVGQSTRLRATFAMGAMIAVGNGGPVDGVYIGDLVLDCAGRAQVGVNLHIVGTGGFYKGEPDPVCRLDNLWVYDATQDGVVYQGADSRSCITSRVRVRRAARYGFRIESTDSWWIACEATTTTSTGSSAGFYASGANNFFETCKAWYCRDYGFHLRTTRSKFVACEAQDIRSHGWYIEWDGNTLTSCVADTCGMYDVGGTPGNADGFYVTPGENLALIGCQAFDRTPSGHTAQQRYGFNVPASMVTAGLLVAPTGWDNASGLIHQR